MITLWVVKLWRSPTGKNTKDRTQSGKNFFSRFDLVRCLMHTNPVPVTKSQNQVSPNEVIMELRIHFFVIGFRLTVQSHALDEFFRSKQLNIMGRWIWSMFFSCDNFWTYLVITIGLKHYILVIHQKFFNGLVIYLYKLLNYIYAFWNNEILNHSAHKYGHGNYSDEFICLYISKAFKHYKSFAFCFPSPLEGYLISIYSPCKFQWFLGVFAWMVSYFQKNLMLCRNSKDWFTYKQIFHIWTLGSCTMSDNYV